MTESSHSAALSQEPCSGVKCHSNRFASQWFYTYKDIGRAFALILGVNSTHLSHDCWNGRTHFRTTFNACNMPTPNALASPLAAALSNLPLNNTNNAWLPLACAGHKLAFNA